MVAVVAEGWRINLTPRRPTITQKAGGTIHPARSIVRTGLLTRSLMIKIYKPRSRKCHPISKLSLPDHRVVVHRPATLAGKRIADKFGLTPAVADLIASLAGFASVGG